MSEASITQLLDQWKTGDRAVEPLLINKVYPVLREIAGAHVRRNSGILTLRSTEIAHEAYEKLCRQQHVDWQNRQHFFAIAATAVRRVVIDYLRQRMAEKRGGEVVFVPLDDLHPDDAPADNAGGVDWLALDQALTRLAAIDPACARVVELRLFGGLSVEEIAEACDSSTATVGRQWRFARTWLAEQLEGGG
jgi:RNA polymerase sigma factor (TIGR02999 family)